MNVNNEAEYEALMTRFKITKELRVKAMCVFNDSIDGFPDEERISGQVCKIRPCLSSVGTTG